MSRHSSFASSSEFNGSQICIGDDRSDGGGGGGCYQLPLGDGDGDASSFDDDDESSAYLYNTSSNNSVSNYNSQPQQQQSAGQHTSSATATITSKTKRRRAANNRKASANARWVDSTQSFLSRDRFVKKYLSDSLLLSNSSFSSNLSASFNNNSSRRHRVSFSSSTSSVSSSSFRFNRREGESHAQASLPASSCYVPVAKTPARAAALEHDILLSSSCSSSSLVADAALVDMARAAKRTLESVAKRQVMVGKWKQRTSVTSAVNSRASTYSQNSDSSTSDCQVYEYLTSSKDQYSIVAKVNLPCSLAEIQSVLAQSASRGTEFHRSMVMLFGDQYVYGLNVRSVDYSRSSLALRRSSAAGLSRRSSTEFMASTGQQQPQQHQPGTTRLAVNAVSLLMKRRLVWRPQNMSFLDFCDERPHTKSVTRVLQTLDADSDDEEEQEEDEDEPHHGGDAHRQTRRRHSRQSSALQMHESKRRRRGLRGLLAGYVLQEDSEEQFTRLFFYANHKSVSAAQSDTQQQAYNKYKKPVKVTSWSVQLIREMVNKLCTLESVVLRRRLGFYPLMDVPVAQSSSTAITYRNSSSSVSSCNSTSSDVALLQTPTGCCSSCYVPFNVLLFRKKHFCHLCGLFICRKCSKVEPIEKVLGLIDRRRVCVSCVSRVSHCAFNLDGDTSDAQQLQLQQQESQQLKGKSMAKNLLFSSDTGKKLANVPEEDFPLLLGDNDDGDGDDDDLASTVLEDLALFPDEQLENDNDLAAEKVATYLKKMFERGSSSMGRKNPFVSQQSQGRLFTAGLEDKGASCPRFFGEIGGGGDEKAVNGGQLEATRTTTPKDSICLLGSGSSLDGEESDDGELSSRQGNGAGTAFA